MVKRSRTKAMRRAELRTPVDERSSDPHASQVKRKRSSGNVEGYQENGMLPKNPNGWGLPQILTGTSNLAEGSVMHLSDSITLTVRNQIPEPQTPKMSDVEAIANILASRGIALSPLSPDSGTAAPGLQLNSNAGVSLTPSIENSSVQESHIPIVDLTDDAEAVKPQTAPQKRNRTSTEPFKCGFCSAEYLHAVGLNEHYQNDHKGDVGLPLINLKQAGVMQKLTEIGIYNYIPLTAATADGMFALPIISTKNPANKNTLGSTKILTLGPMRKIPRSFNTADGVQDANQRANRQNK